MEPWVLPCRVLCVHAHNGDVIQHAVLRGKAATFVSVCIRGTPATQTSICVLFVAVGVVAGHKPLQACSRGWLQCCQHCMFGPECMYAGTKAPTCVCSQIPSYMCSVCTMTASSARIHTQLGICTQPGRSFDQVWAPGTALGALARTLFDTECSKRMIY